MRDPIEGLIAALGREEGGIVIVWSPDLGMRDWLASEVESLASPESRPFRTATVEDALSEPDRMALILPENEREVVLDLDGSRDRLRNEEAQRTQPIVLVLLRDGDGRKALAQEAISLRSWVGGSATDPDAVAAIDVEKERDAFVTEAGRAPAAWLADWRSGLLPHNGENYRRAYRAMLLEQS